MSLLLDALKQAEQNKKHQDGAAEDNRDVAAAHNLSVEDNESPEKEEEWTELEVLPDFDLTPVAAESVSSEKDSTETGSALSVESSSALQLEQVNDEPEPLMAIEAMDIPAEPESEEPEKSDETETAETEQDKTAEPQADSISTGSTDKHVPESSTVKTAIKAEDIEAARAILQSNHTQKDYKTYALWLIILVMLCGTAAYFLFFSATLDQSSVTEDYPPTEGMMEEGDMEDGEIAASEASDSASQPVMAHSEPSERVTSPKKDTTASNEASIRSVKPQNKPKRAVQPQFQSFDASSPIRIKIKKPSRQIDRELMQAYDAYRQQDYSLARQRYQRVLRRDPEQVDAWLGLAAIAERQGRVNMAKKFYQRVLQLDGQQSYAQNALIRLQRIQSPAEQEVLYRQLAGKNPQNAAAQAALARFYVTQKRWRQAQVAYFKAVSLAPENAVYHYNLAVCLDHLGKSEAALRYYQKTLQLSSESQAGIDVVRIKQRIQQLQGT